MNWEEEELSITATCRTSGSIRKQTPANGGFHFESHVYNRDGIGIWNKNGKLVDHGPWQIHDQ